MAKITSPMSRYYGMDAWAALAAMQFKQTLDIMSGRVFTGTYSDLIDGPVYCEDCGAYGEEVCQRCRLEREGEAFDPEAFESSPKRLARNFWS